MVAPDGGSNEQFIGPEGQGKANTGKLPRPNRIRRNGRGGEKGGAFGLRFSKMRRLPTCQERAGSPSEPKEGQS